jgi:hypothetical protein
MNGVVRNGYPFLFGFNYKRNQENYMSIKYVPSSWVEITLSDQMEVERLTSIGINKTIAIISGYCRIPVQEVKKMNLNQINEIIDRLSFLSELPESKPVMEFDFDGHRYSVIQSMFKSEFQDFISLESLLEQYSGSTYNALPYLCAVMCKRKVRDEVIGKNVRGEVISLPKWETLDDYDIMERGEQMRRLPMSIAYGIYSFFLSFNGMYTIDLQQLINQHRLLVEQYSESIQSSTRMLDGKGWHYRLLAMMLRRFTRYIVLSWKRSFSTIQS